jgi:hypothetical protein
MNFKKAGTFGSVPRLKHKVGNNWAKERIRGNSNE